VPRGDGERVRAEREHERRELGDHDVAYASFDAA
jgi:hypothetical protein